MKTTSISISTQSVSGYGVGPISNENTLIMLVIKI